MKEAKKCKGRIFALLGGLVLCFILLNGCAWRRYVTPAASSNYPNHVSAIYE